jgi:hypothetical protein
VRERERNEPIEVWRVVVRKKQLAIESVIQLENTVSQVAGDSALVVHQPACGALMSTHCHNYPKWGSYLLWTKSTRESPETAAAAELGLGEGDGDRDGDCDGDGEAGELGTELSA